MAYNAYYSMALVRMFLHQALIWSSGFLQKNQSKQLFFDCTCTHFHWLAQTPSNIRHPFRKQSVNHWGSYFKCCSIGLVYKCFIIVNTTNCIASANSEFLENAVAH